MTWTKEKPTLPGLYLYKDDREWVVQLGTVRHGDWKRSQNPQALYYKDRPVDSMYEGLWLCVPRIPGDWDAQITKQWG